MTTKGVKKRTPDVKSYIWDVVQMCQYFSERTPLDSIDWKYLIEMKKVGEFLLKEIGNVQD